MTILLRLEKPDFEITVCGMPQQAWLDGLANGKIANAQGGLTSGQIGWLQTHRDIEGAPEAPTRRAQRRQRRGRPEQFDLVDTEEL